MKYMIGSLLCVAGLMLLSACSKPEAPKEVAVEAPQPVSKTSGQITFNGIPEEGLLVREVIVVSQIDEETRAHLERQREFFELKIRGEVYTPTEWESSEEFKQFAAKLRQVTESYPEPLVVDVDLGNNRLRKFQSDMALYKEYKPLFTALSPSNMERGIEFIDKKISVDVERLQKQVSSENPDQSKLAEVTLEWLQQVHTTLAGCVQLANESLQQQSSFAQGYAKAMAQPKSWDEYARAYNTSMIVGVSRGSLGAAELNDDGSFEVEGQGQLVVRLEYTGAASAYLLPQDAEETRAEVSNLREYTESF